MCIFKVAHKKLLTLEITTNPVKSRRRTTTADDKAYTRKELLEPPRCAPVGTRSKHPARNQTETFSTSDPVLTSYLSHSWHNSWLILQVSKWHKHLHKHLTCEYIIDHFSFIVAICKNVITLRKMVSASLNNYWMFISYSILCNQVNFHTSLIQKSLTTIYCSRQWVIHPHLYQQCHRMYLYSYLFNLSLTFNTGSFDVIYRLCFVSCPHAHRLTCEKVNSAVGIQRLCFRAFKCSVAPDLINEKSSRTLWELKRGEGLPL